MKSELSYTVIYNAIELRQYVFSNEKRDEIRRKLGVENYFVVGNVARMSFQKNHDFLISIFYEIAKIRDDAFLLLVGDGELRQEVRDKIKLLQLENRVLDLGVRDDVPELLNAFDVFLLPTRYEGLGIVLIEAQANGLRCYASDKVVPYEANIYGGIEFISLNKDAKSWADIICSNDNNRRIINNSLINNNNYNIDFAVQQLKNIYFNLCNIDN